MFYYPSIHPSIILHIYTFLVNVRDPEVTGVKWHSSHPQTLNRGDRETNRTFQSTIGLLIPALTHLKMHSYQWQLLMMAVILVDDKDWWGEKREKARNMLHPLQNGVGKDIMHVSPAQSSLLSWGSARQIMQCILQQRGGPLIPHLEHPWEWSREDFWETVFELNHENE